MLVHKIKTNSEKTYSTAIKLQSKQSYFSTQATFLVLPEPLEDWESPLK